MAAYVNQHFENQMPEMQPNASFVGLHLKDDQSGIPDSLDFTWDFPYIEEDIWLSKEFQDFKFEKTIKSDEQEKAQHA